MRSVRIATLTIACWTAIGCQAQDADGHGKTAATVRAERRAFDGAPPVIGHEPLGAECLACHTSEGTAIPEIGFAPANPHGRTAGMSPLSRCRQCHVFKNTEELFRPASFVGLQQDLRRGSRLNALAPPVIPHLELMRENCQSCHTGPAAREEIRTSHPERARCRQCHLQTRDPSQFARR